MVHAYRQTVLDWFATIWEKGELQTLDRFMTQKTVFHSADGLALKGFDEFRASQLQLRTFFHKFRCIVKATVIEEPYLAATVRVQAVHRLTKKPVRFQAMNRVLFDKEGKIAEAWDTIDWLSCLIQIGALPQDALLKGLTGKKLG